MNVTIMIPMTPLTARDLNLWPDNTSRAGHVECIRWPEIDNGIPELDTDLAAGIEEAIRRDENYGVQHLVIVTRAEAVLTRVRRMVAEGADLRVTVCLARDDGQEHYEVNECGALFPWPSGLFDLSGADALAMVAARRRRSMNAR